MLNNEKNEKANANPKKPKKAQGVAIPKNQKYSRGIRKTKKHLCQFDNFQKPKKNQKTNATYEFLQEGLVYFW
jgi:hypothetical protein